MLQLFILSCLAAAQDGAMTLDPKGAAKLSYYPITVPLVAEKPAGLTKEPEYRGTPKYGRVRVGNGPRSSFTLAVDMPATGEWRIFVDLNRNGDLSDDGPGTWTAKREQPRTMYGVMDVVFRASYGTATEEITSSDYSLSFYHFVDTGRLLYFRQSARIGTVSIGGKSIKAVLAENDGDAVFNARYATADEAFPHRPIWLKLEATTVDVRGPFLFEGKTYEATVNPDGSRVEILPTDKPVVILDLAARAHDRHRSGDFDGAIADWTRLIDADPGWTIQFEGRGRSKMAKGDSAGAIEDFNRAIRLEPKKAAAYELRATAKSILKNHDGAIVDATRAIELDPKNAGAYATRGLARSSNKDSDGAMSDYTKAIELNPKDSSTYNNRALLKHDLKDLDGAVADATRSIEIFPTANTYRRRGDMRRDQKDIDGAIADWTKSIELNPKDPEPWNQRGLAKVARKDLAGALADFSSVLQLVPRAAGVLMSRAYVRNDLRDWTGALEDFRRHVELDPRMADYDRFRIWLIRVRLGQRADADSELAAYVAGRKEGKPDDWPSKILGFLLGKQTEAEFLAAAKDADPKVTKDQDCEAFFYAGSVRLLNGDKPGAAALFQKCLDTGIESFYEFQSAAAELDAIKKGS